VVETFIAKDNMAQISKGHQYEASGDNSQVTYENLNQHVDNATLLAGAIKEQDVVSFANGGDELLLAQTSSLVKITKTNFIGGQTELGGSGYINFGDPVAAFGIGIKIGADGLQVQKRQSGGGAYGEPVVNYLNVSNVGNLDYNSNENGIVEASRIVISNMNDDTLNSHWGNRLELLHGTKFIVHGRNATKALTPSGAIIAFAGQAAPAGWLICNGQTLDGTSTAVEPDYDEDLNVVPRYYALWLVVGTIYGGTGQSSFKVPDLRGEFIRGFDHGNGADPRTFGSTQKDLVKAHKHIASNNDCNPNYATINGVGTGNYNTWCDTNGTASGAGAALTGDGTHIEQVVSGIPTVGSETRPRNIALNYIIKI
jgi:microcystin-dependent protein